MNEEIKYLDKAGTGKLISEIKKRIAKVYDIKGSAVYADQRYLDGVSAGNSDYIAAITAKGLWVNDAGTWKQVTAVKDGWVYNVTNGFVTDEDFVEGAGHRIVAGTNIVAVNKGTESEPIMKWDLLAMSVSLDHLQTKQLSEPITVFTNQTPEVYTSAANLPTKENVDAATITDNMVAVLGGTTENGDVYRAKVAVDMLDTSKNTITWTKLGNQSTVEGVLNVLANVTPNTPLSAAEISELFASA